MKIRVEGVRLGNLNVAKEKASLNGLCEKDSDWSRNTVKTK